MIYGGRFDLDRSKKNKELRIVQQSTFGKINNLVKK